MPSDRVIRELDGRAIWYIGIYRPDVTRVVLRQIAEPERIVMARSEWESLPLWSGAALARLWGGLNERLNCVPAQDNSREASRLSHLDIGQEWRICDVAGRQGFYMYEDTTKFSWLQGVDNARMAFAATPSRACLHLKMFRIIESYPMDELGLVVNGTKLAYRWTRHDEGWGLLESEPFEASSRNLMTLTVPYEVPVRELDPTSPDKRQLSVAVASVMLVAA